MDTGGEDPDEVNKHKKHRSLDREGTGNREQISPLEGHQRRHNKTTVDTTSTPTATPTTKSTCIANASESVSPSDTMEWTRLRRSVVADLYVICDIYKQAINILPLYFAEPVKHWFYLLSDNSKTSIMSFKSVLFTRQGDGKDIDSYIFRLRQAASDQTIPVADLTKKAIKGLRQFLRGRVYMRKPKSMEEPRQETRLVERGLNMTKPLGDDIADTVEEKKMTVILEPTQYLANLKLHVAAESLEVVKIMNLRGYLIL